MTWTITEKDLEDWAEMNIRSILGNPRAEVVGRQVQLPSGRRLDLLVGVRTSGGRIRWIVVELKAGTADASAVIQLLRYMGEIHGIEETANTEWLDVYGLLVAPDFTTEALHAIGGSWQLSCSRVRMQFKVESPWNGVIENPELEARAHRRGWVEVLEEWEEMGRHFKERRRRSLAIAPLSTTPHQWRGLTLMNGGDDG